MGKRRRRKHQRPPKAFPKPAPKPEEKRSIPKWVLYIRNTGGGLAVVSLFPLFWFPEFYWYGVVFLIAGFALLSLEALLEEWKRPWRIAVSAWWLAVGVLVLIRFVFVAAPIDIVAYADDGNYTDGADIHKIKWEPGMSELRIVIANRTDHDYDNVDFAITPNVPTRKVSQITDFPDISLPIIESSEFGDIVNGGIKAKDQDGKVLNGGSTDLYASGMGFRMLCPIIPRNSTVELFAALVNPPRTPSTGPSDKNKVVAVDLLGDLKDFAGPKIKATSVHIKGRYTVLNHPHAVERTYKLD
jgi:hypothetical protein